MNKYIQNLLTKLKPQNILRVHYTSLRLQSTTSLFLFYFIVGAIFSKMAEISVFWSPNFKKNSSFQLCSLILQIWRTLNWIICFLESWHGIISFIYFLHTSQLSFSHKGGGHGLKFSFKKSFTFESFFKLLDPTKIIKVMYGRKVEGILFWFFSISNLPNLGAICKRMGMRM